MRQSGCHPWRKCPFNGANVQNLKIVFKDQSLCDVEQRLELFEAGFLADEQVVLVILSEVNCCFYRRHKSSPDQYIGLLIKYLSLSGRFNFFRGFLETFPTYSFFVGYLHVVVVQLLPYQLVPDPSHKFPCAC